MKKIVISCLISLIVISSFSQTPNDTIILKKVFGGYQFYQLSKRLTIPQVIKTLQSNDIAYQEMQKAQNNYIWSSIFGAIGGFMIG